MKMVSFSNTNFFKSWSKVYHPDKDLSPRLAYKAKAISDYLMDQNKKFVDLREAIIKKYAKKDDKGNLVIEEGNYIFEPTNIESVNKDFSELMNLDLEPPVPSRLKVEELEKDGVKLSGPDVAILSDLLDFGDESKPPLALVPPQSK